VFQSDRARLDAAYPRIADFRSLAERLDPAGAFRNVQTSEWLGL
jgi:xylitol oxidase